MRHEYFAASFLPPDCGNPFLPREQSNRLDCAEFAPRSTCPVRLQGRRRYAQSDACFGNPDEGITLNDGRGLRMTGDIREIGAAGERTLANLLHAAWNGDGLDVETAVESFLADDRHTLADDIFLHIRTKGGRDVVQPVVTGGSNILGTDSDRPEIRTPGKSSLAK